MAVGEMPRAPLMVAVAIAVHNAPGQRFYSPIADHVAPNAECGQFYTDRAWYRV
jgi:hypothetical protein